ncbi:Site-specific recombinase XerD [Dethiosulfatibacter aminovorans DSM 17477]|uniref:Site-specific recombinase XerD n=1 Tax=Dethiosulfatibacter aminovorans DSM 17477 TaxID=1121476 RepID=A0A1M6IGH2_9FIRM|nr:tyrosine-type recombinase/integrase [Dethiosulfatibacter aminovorans]SHJ33528.1 Site-specific recombinase XerD [Dethiosulfatibacter aminovorans DSM 17477]
MKKTYEWKSDLSELIQSYIAEKQMCGFKFIAQERELKHFDEYYFQMGYNGIRLTKPMVNNYIYDSVFDRKSTYYAKERVLHCFGEFLCSHGYKSYIVPIKSRSLKRTTHTPYIFSKEELKRFFVAIDTYPYTSFTNRNRIDPVLFRLLYGSGLRISEALNIQCRDVDFASGTLTIRHAKNNKNRLVPVSKSLNDRFNALYQDVHKFSDGNTYFFISPQGGRLDISTAYCRFRDYLVKAGISHTDSGPRMHDLRHTYAVHCFKRWVLSGQELTNILPYLAAYMGHSDFRATQYYLRLTADLYPDILAKTELAFAYIIPEGGDVDES